MSLQKIVTTMLLAFVGFIFIINFTPTVEAQVVSANITNPLVSTIVDMAAWLLPVGGLIGIFYGIFRLFKGSGAKG